MRWIWEYLNAFNLENNTELELAHGDVTPRAHFFLEVPLRAISFSVILLVERYVLVNTEETRVSQHGFARCKETTKHQDRGESVPIIEFPPSPDMVRSLEHVMVMFILWMKHPTASSRAVNAWAVFVWNVRQLTPWSCGRGGPGRSVNGPLVLRTSGRHVEL